MLGWSRLVVAAALLCASPPVARLQIAGSAAAAAQMPERCSGLTQFGAYDTRPATGDADRALSFRNWLCQANIALDSDMQAAGATLGLPPARLPSALGFDPKTQDFLQWRDGYCAAYPGDKRVADKTAALVRQITPGVVAALAECRPAPGLYARLETTARPCDVQVRLNFAAAPDATPPNDVQLVATDASLTCQPARLETPFAVPAGTDLMCRRHADRAMVLMLQAPSLHVSRIDRIMELPQMLAPPQDTLSGDFQVDIAWRDRAGRPQAPTRDLWRLTMDKDACRIAGGGTAYTPNSTWFTQTVATCSPDELRVTGYRAFDPATGGASNFSLLLRSSDNGDSYQGNGRDTLGRVAVIATARRSGARAVADQVVCEK